MRRVLVGKSKSVSCYRITLLHAVGIPAVALLLLTSCHHAAELVLSSELAIELTVGGNQLLADADDGLLWRDATVRLDSEQELRHIGMSDYGTCQFVSSGQRKGQGYPCMLRTERVVLV